MLLRGSIAALVLCASTVALARSTPFDAGRLHLSLGTTLAMRDAQRYVVVLVGLGYYVTDGLELGAELEHWFVGRPSITRVSPQVRYVFHFLQPVAPYVGAFYRHWFIGSGGRDLDSLGARAGLYILAGSTAAIAIGGSYETLLSCSGGGCSSLYPEVVLALTF